MEETTPPGVNLRPNRPSEKSQINQFLAVRGPVSAVLGAAFLPLGYAASPDRTTATNEALVVRNKGEWAGR